MFLDFDQECFFITPIGGEGTDIRRRSDGVREWVVKPAARAFGLQVVRADDVGEPGQITSQVVQHCLKAKAAVADLTGGNPNVYYELSIRHSAQLPVALIAAEGTDLPFDISQSRVIFFDHTDLISAGNAREELQRQIAASLQGVPNNPIIDGMRLAELRSGNYEEQTLASLMELVRKIAAQVDRLESGAVGEGRLRSPKESARLTRAEKEALASIETLPLVEEQGPRMTAEEVSLLSQTMLKRIKDLRAAERDAQEVNAGEGEPDEPEAPTSGT